VFVGFGVASAPAAQAQAVEGLTVSSTTVFTPDVEGEHIDVASTYTITNVQADDLIDGSVRSYFFTTWVIAVPAAVTDFAATSGSATLISTLEDDPDTDDIAFATITLPFNLNFQQTVTLDVSYTVPGGDPRSEGVVARVNDSFLSFSVWAAGDPGNTNIRVDVPDGFSLDLRGELDELQQVPGETYYEATNIAEPRDFFGQVFGRNDSGLLTQEAELPNAVATVRAWPDDPEWADFVVDAIEEGVPVIEDLTGIDWPAGDIEVIETLTPYLYGYGGWFNATSGVIEIGENLERDLILHELTHAWFNDDLVDGRWITEGLAEEFASRTIEATGDPLPDPEKPDLADPLRVQLSDWASPWTLRDEDAFAYELYHYNASWWVVRQITDDVGLDAFADVLVSMHEDELTYEGTNDVREETELSAQWTHFFDLLEFDAGATNLDELFSTYVLSPDDAALLGPRRAALARYDDLAEISGAWESPPVLRQAMATWQFADAEDHMATANEIITQRDRADELAAELQVTIEHPSKAIYEMAVTAEDLDAAATAEADLVDNLSQLSDDRTALAAEAGAAGTQVGFGPMGYDEAVANIAEQRAAIANVDDLVGQVDARSQALGLDAPAWPTDATTTGSTDFVAVAALAEARLATLDAIATASDRVDADRSLTQRVGLFGSDATAEIAAARDAFESDDLDDALTATATAESMIANSASTGRTRLTWTAAIIATALLATLAIRLRKPNR